jgi:hypothetical protein
MYQAMLVEDAKQLGLAPPRPGALAAVFPYADELPPAGPRILRPGAGLKTRHLSLTLLVRKEQGAVEGQPFRADHLVLRIQNLGGRHLAYRVATRMVDAGRCEAKGRIAHDAIALAPHEVVFRTECLHRRETRVEVTGIEVMELPPLSYHYVSRLTPELVLYDPRTAAGHAAPKGSTCPQTFSWREIRDGAARGAIAWRDIIDFYARHNCDEHTFFAGYRYRTDPAAPLPAVPARADAGDRPAPAEAEPRRGAPAARGANTP